MPARFWGLIVHFTENTVAGAKTSRARERRRANLRGKLVLSPCLYGTRVPKHLLVGRRYYPLLQRWLNDGAQTVKLPKPGRSVRLI